LDDVWLSVRGLQIARDATRSKGRPTGPRNRLGRPAWANQPGPVSAQFVSSFAQCCFPRLLDPLPFCMWALVVGFSPNWTKLLVLQDSALFLVRSLEFIIFSGLVLGLLESCSLHCLTCIGLQGLVMRCLMNLSRKCCFQR
jgi:hypothetical protein